MKKNSQPPVPPEAPPKPNTPGLPQENPNDPAYEKSRPFAGSGNDARDGDGKAQ